MDGGGCALVRERRTATTTTTITATPGSITEATLLRVAAITADAGLQYHINFPAGIDAGGGDGEHCQQPVVLLFGWAGCQDKYLAKYAKIYEDRGLITLRYIVPIKYLLWRRQRVVRIGQQLVQLLHELRVAKHPIIVHCFSNGGAFLYQNFSLALGAEPGVDVRGVIFDSSPGRRRLLSLYKAITAIVGGGRVYNALLSLLFLLLCSLIWLWEVVQKCVGGGGGGVADPFDRLRDEAHAWPQHFIYSEADELISYRDVETFIRHRERLGVRVTALRYKSSAHVRHLAAHKETYTASVLAFVDECLTTTPPRL